MTRPASSAGCACLLLSSAAWAGPIAIDARLAAPAGMAHFDWAPTTVFPVVATPGRITDIVLEPQSSETILDTGVAVEPVTSGLSLEPALAVEPDAVFGVVEPVTTIGGLF